MSSLKPQYTPPRPAAAIAAPVSPPIIAWVDDDGRLNLHVMMFHRVALRSPTIRTKTVVSPESIVRRPESVNATALPPSIAPRRAREATKMIPGFGAADLEAINVAAMELAS